MKSYMNKQERDDYIMLSSLEGKATEILRNWSEHNSLAKDEKRYLKTALTYMDKVLGGILSRMGDEFLKPLIRDIKGTNLICIPKYKEKDYQKEYAQEYSEENCLVNRAALEYIMEKSAYWCCDCRETNKADCKLRACYMEVAMPIYAENQECPYEIKKEPKYTYKNLAKKYVEETGKDLDVDELAGMFKWFKINS